MDEEVIAQTQLNLDAIGRVQTRSSNADQEAKEDTIVPSLAKGEGTPIPREQGLRYLLWHLNSARRRQ